MCFTYFLKKNPPPPDLPWRPDDRRRGIEPCAGYFRRWGRRNQPSSWDNLRFIFPSRYEPRLIQSSGDYRRLGRDHHTSDYRSGHRCHAVFTIYKRAANPSGQYRRGLAASYWRNWSLIRMWRNRGRGIVWLRYEFMSRSLLIQRWGWIIVCSILNN